MKSCAEIRGAKNKDRGRDKLTLRRSCGDQGRRRTNRCVDTTQRLWRPTVARKNEICRHYAAVVTTEEGETNRNALKLRSSFGDRAGRNKRNALTPRSVCGDPGNGKNIKSSGCGDQGGANKHKCVETTQRLWRPTGARKNKTCFEPTQRLCRPRGAKQPEMP